MTIQEINKTKGNSSDPYGYIVELLEGIQMLNLLKYLFFHVICIVTTIKVIESKYWFTCPF